MRDNESIWLIFIIALAFAWLVRKYFKLRKRYKKNEAQLNRSQAQVRNLEDEISSLNQSLEENRIDSLRFALNPHTFKNTLSSIQYLAQNTLQTVSNLTGVIDYMLYDGKLKFVELTQEARFAQEYFQLYQAQLKPHVRAKADIDLEHIEEKGENLVIAPLIVAHFIENAFKHGDKESEKALIELKMELLEQELVLSVRNRIGPKSKSRGGLGKEKFQERLDILYPGKHHIEYTENGETHTANLKLKLDAKT